MKVTVNGGYFIPEQIKGPWQSWNSTISDDLHSRFLPSATLFGFSQVTLWNAIFKNFGRKVKSLVLNCNWQLIKTNKKMFF